MVYQGTRVEEENREIYIQLDRTKLNRLKSLKLLKTFTNNSKSRGRTRTNNSTTNWIQTNEADNLLLEEIPSFSCLR